MSAGPLTLIVSAIALAALFALLALWIDSDAHRRPR